MLFHHEGMLLTVFLYIASFWPLQKSGEVRVIITLGRHVNIFMSLKIFENERWGEEFKEGGQKEKLPDKY